MRPYLAGLHIVIKEYLKRPDSLHRGIPVIVRGQHDKAVNAVDLARHGPITADAQILSCEKSARSAHPIEDWQDSESDS